MRDELRTWIAVEHFNTVLLTALGLVGLLLAAIGIYGVVGYFVTMRTHEIGVRMALGASARNVLQLLAWQGMRPILVGIVAGGALAAWATTLLRKSLFGVDPRDPATFIVVGVVLGVTGLVASVVSALRASHIDPSRTLK